MRGSSYNHSVFINCPFDGRYLPLFRATIFTVVKCGYDPRSALEEDDACEIRLHKIFRMIEESRFGIHDLSRTESDGKARLPRFNMPLELGIFLAAKRFGVREQDRKVCLIFERKPHSYEAFISDIKGQDVMAHQNDPQRVVVMIRNWLAANSGRRSLPGGHAVWHDYKKFKNWLPSECRRVNQKEQDLVYNDYVQHVYAWMERQNGTC